MTDDGRGPRTRAGRQLLDALHHKGITRLEDGYFEDTDVRIEDEAAPVAALDVGRLAEAMQNAENNGTSFAASTMDRLAVAVAAEYARLACEAE